MDDNTREAGQPGSEGADDLVSRIGAAIERLEHEPPGPSPAWPIRAPRTWGELREGVWLPGMSAPGGDIPSRWVPPEFADRLEYGESSGNSREAGS
jgi:hypothetical protein